MLMICGSIFVSLQFELPRLPQAGERLLASGGGFRPGGGGLLLALAARCFGAAVRLVGAVGDDALADAALDPLRVAGIDIAGVRHLRGSRTGFECGLGGGLVCCPGANAELRAHWVSDADLADARCLLLDADMALPQAAALATRARAAGCRALLRADAAHRLQLQPGVIDIVVAGSHALQRACLDHGLPFEAASPASGAQALARRLGCAVLSPLAHGQAVLADGSSVIARQCAVPSAAPAEPASLVFAGVVSAALALGLSTIRAIDHALAALALSNPRGAAVPARPVVEEALLRHAPCRA